jgi:hypothetical protein
MFDEYPDVTCSVCRCVSWLEGCDPRRWGWVEKNGVWTCKQCCVQGPGYWDSPSFIAAGERLKSSSS